MRQRAEDQLCFAEWRVFGCREGEILISDARGLAALPMSSGEPQLHTGMLRDEHAELSASVPAGTKYADRKFMH